MSSLNAEHQLELGGGDKSLSGGGPPGGAPPTHLHFDSGMAQTSQSQSEQLTAFWEKARQNIASMTNFKDTKLPLSRIKRIMKSDEDVRMISTEAPLLFAKACELFIVELTLRAWFNTEEGKRKTLQRNDIAMAITKTDVYDFLIDIVPPEDNKLNKKAEESLRISVPSDYHYHSQQPPMHPPPAYPIPTAAAAAAAAADDEHMLARQQQQQQQQQQQPPPPPDAVMFSYPQPIDQAAQYRHPHVLQHYSHPPHVLHLPNGAPTEHHHQQQIDAGHEYYAQPGQEFQDTSTQQQSDYLIMPGHP